MTDRYCPTCDGTGKVEELPFTPQPPSECDWIVDTEGTYATDCGHHFQFNDGTPAENEAAFCLYCGKTLHYVAFDPHQEDT